MKILTSIYTFVVGDMIILVGVIITIIVLSLIHALSALAPWHIVSGIILMIAVLAVLIATLCREAFAKS
jgi:hypothetical protein